MMMGFHSALQSIAIIFLLFEFGWTESTVAFESTPNYEITTPRTFTVEPIAEEDYEVQWWEIVIGVVAFVLIFVIIVGMLRFLIVRTKKQLSNFFPDETRFQQQADEISRTQMNERSPEFYRNRSSLHEGFMLQLEVRQPENRRSRPSPANNNNVQPVPFMTNRLPRNNQVVNDEPPAYDIAIDLSLPTTPHKDGERGLNNTGISFESEFSEFEAPPSYFVAQQTTDTTDYRS